MNVVICVVSSLSPLERKQLTQNLVNAKKRGEYFSISPASIPAQYLRLNKQLRNNMALIALATDGETIVGSMYATFSRFPTRKNLAKFNKLTVNPDHRGQGIAKRLFTELETAVKKQGKTVSGFYCHADNPARKLYQTMGYKEETRGDCSSDCLISLHKKL